MELSMVLGVILAVLGAVKMAVFQIRKDAVQQRDNEAALSDAIQADDIRRNAQTVQENLRDEAHSISDDDLTDRLSEARKRTR